MQFLNKEFLDGGIDLLLSEKSKICVSIIVPTHRLSPDRRVDELAVQRAFLKVKEELREKYKHEEVQEFIATLDRWLQELDFSHNKEGLGFFLSDNIKLQMQFSFPVQKKTFVGERFLFRDLLYQLSYSFPYYVLQLMEKKARLYKGRLSDLVEVNNETFPVDRGDQYEYERPSRGSSYTGHSVVQSFEKDPSLLEEIRIESFLHQVDQRLKAYDIDNIPLIVCGQVQDVSSFKKTTRYSRVTSSFLAGDYQHINEKELGDLVWPLIKADFDEKKLSLINQFKETVGAGLTESGLLESWRATVEGRGYRLLIEKDYTVQAYLAQENNLIYLDRPSGTHTVLPDAADELIQKVVERKGEVIFVENEMLNEYQHVALFTRY